MVAQASERNTQSGATFRLRHITFKYNNLFQQSCYEYLLPKLRRLELDHF